MNDWQYIRITYLPIWVRAFSKAYVLQAYLEQDSDHRWNARIDALSDCTAWRYTQEEALTTLRDAVEVYTR
jgi:predicted RNase H-like HicB family nuclease